MLDPDGWIGHKVAGRTNARLLCGSQVDEPVQHGLPGSGELVYSGSASNRPDRAIDERFGRCMSGMVGAVSISAKKASLLLRVIAIAQILLLAFVPAARAQSVPVVRDAEIEALMR